MEFSRQIPSLFVKEGRTDADTLAEMLAVFRDLPGNFAAMQARLALPPTIVRVGAWLLAALVVGWVVSGWFWQIVAPNVAPRLEAAPLPDHQAAVQAVVARHLFGRPAFAGDGTAGESGGLNFRLLGAMTGSADRAGFAVLAEEGKPSLAAVEGEEVKPGVTLVEILPGKVRLKVGDRVETIEMTKSASTDGIVLEGPRTTTPASAPVVDRNSIKRLDAPPRNERQRP
jgi:general secretion pathway protein C